MKPDIFEISSFDLYDVVLDFNVLLFSHSLGLGISDSFGCLHRCIDWIGFLKRLELVQLFQSDPTLWTRSWFTTRKSQIEEKMCGVLILWTMMAWTIWGLKRNCRKSECQSFFLVGPDMYDERNRLELFGSDDDRRQCVPFYLFCFFWDPFHQSFESIAEKMEMLADSIKLLCCERQHWPWIQK
jgi:predicted membrane protein